MHRTYDQSPLGRSKARKYDQSTKGIARRRRYLCRLKQMQTV